MKKKSSLLLTKFDRDLVNRYIKIIEDLTGVPSEQFTKINSRKTEAVYLRHITMFQIHKNTRWSLQNIAEYVGLTNHTSVIHGLKKVNEWKDLPQFYKNELLLLKEIENEYTQRYPDTVELSA
jgi:chromosomal replication initiation ATPase DnaA